MTRSQLLPIVIVTDEAFDDEWEAMRQRCKATFQLYAGFWRGLWSRLRWAGRVVFMPRKYRTVLSLEFTLDRAPIADDYGYDHALRVYGAAKFPQPSGRDVKRHQRPRRRGGAA